jgi:hypothetical protein
MESRAVAEFGGGILEECVNRTAGHEQDAIIAGKVWARRGRKRRTRSASLFVSAGFVSSRYNDADDLGT